MTTLAVEEIHNPCQRWVAMKCRNFPDEASLFPEHQQQQQPGTNTTTTSTTTTLVPATNSSEADTDHECALHGGPQHHGTNACAQHGGLQQYDTSAKVGTHPNSTMEDDGATADAAAGGVVEEEATTRDG